MGPVLPRKKVEDYIEFLGVENSVTGMRYFSRKGIEGHEGQTLEEGDYVIMAFTPAQLDREANLKTLAPSWAWQEDFTFVEVDPEGKEKRKMSWKAASEWIIERSRAGISGIWNPEKIRGRGVWLDKSRYVMHLGDRLIVDGNIRPLSALSGGRYVYSRLEAMEIPVLEPLSNEEVQLIIEGSRLFDWERPIYADLFAGWIAIACICGGFEWRPHQWLTGAPGSGKSTAWKFIKAVLGPFHLAFASNDTTEASMRQRIGNDAIPVVFDEAEATGPRGLDDMQRKLQLIRAASTETGAMISKGTSSQKAITFQIRSMFFLSSVGLSLMEEQDKQRFVVLGLKPPLHTETDNTRRTKQHQTVLNLMKKITSVFAGKFLVRQAQLLPIIKKNIVKLVASLNPRLMDQRKAEMYGTLLAGRLSLDHGKELTHEEIEMYLETFNWDEVKNDTTDAVNVEFMVLEKLLTSVIKVTIDGRNMDMAISEILTKIKYSTLNTDDYVDALSRYGLKYVPKKESLFISNNNQYLKKLFATTQVAVNWNNTLKLVPGASASATEKFFGVTQRGRYIPVGGLIEEKIEASGEFIEQKQTIEESRSLGESSEKTISVMVGDKQISFNLDDDTTPF